MDQSQIPTSIALIVAVVTSIGVLLGGLGGLGGLAQFLKWVDGRKRAKPPDEGAKADEEKRQITICGRGVRYIFQRDYSRRTEVFLTKRCEMTSQN